MLKPLSIYRKISSQYAYCSVFRVENNVNNDCNNKNFSGLLLLSRKVRKYGRAHGNEMAENSVPTTSLLCVKRKFSND